MEALPHAVDVEPVIADVMSGHASVVRELGLPSGILEGDMVAFRVMCDSWKGQPLSDEGYDALVGFGERWSSRIVVAYLAAEGLPAVWASAWSMVQTDDRHRAAGWTFKPPDRPLPRRPRAGRDAFR